jgi:hypothetical protein
LYSEVQLHTWIESIAMIKNQYSDLRTALIDSRNLMTRSHLVNEIANDAYIYNELSSNAKQFAKTVESLLQTVNAFFPPGRVDQAVQQPLSELLVEMQGLCSDLQFKVDQLSNDLQHHLKFLELRRGVQESSSLWTLSILASIFLPLSLASSLLSMGTRFTDLGILLYDFCAISVFLITLAGLLIGIARMALWSREKVADSHTTLWWKRILLFGVALVLFTFWALVLSSFIIGLVQEPRLGGRILGFGTAGLVGVLIIVIVLHLGVRRSIKWLLGSS